MDLPDPRPGFPPYGIGFLVDRVGMCGACSPNFSQTSEDSSWN